MDTDGNWQYMYLCQLINSKPVSTALVSTACRLAYTELQKCMLLYEAIEDERAEVCFVFHNAQSVLHFPLENIASEIVLRRC